MYMAVLSIYHKILKCWFQFKTFYESQINFLSISSGFAPGRWPVISAYKTAAHPLIFYGGLWRPGLLGKNKILKEIDSLKRCEKCECN